MNLILDELQAAVLALPEAERARLAATILASLGEGPDADADWVAEVRDRLAAYRRGELDAVPAEEVLTRARRIAGV
ncbi:MAG: hypothetical protein AMXMBFR53_38810 [Gemmatimonadota bacterium]